MVNKLSIKSHEPFLVLFKFKNTVFIADKKYRTVLFGGINLDNFNEFYMLQTSAKDFEKKGQDLKALDIYLDVINNYFPNNDFSFERAATLLEKHHRYSEALEICDKAINLIKTEKIEGNKDTFENKIARIKTKIGNQVESKKQKKPEEFKFGVPGFRSNNKVLMIIASIYYITTLVFSLPDKYFQYIFGLALVFSIDYFWEALEKLTKQKPYIKSFLVFLLSLVICIYSGLQFLNTDKEFSAIDSDKQSSIPTESTETASSGEGSSEEDVDFDKEPPEIPEKYIDAITNTGNLNHEIDNTFVFLEGRVLFFELIVKPGTSEKNIKRIVEDMAYELGNLMESEGLQGANDKTYGEVYEYYSINIIASNEFDESLLEGTLNGSSNEILWK